MKKVILTCLVICLFIFVKAQVPNKFNYQGYARNSLGQAIPNATINMRFSITDGSPSGLAVYTETRKVTTSSIGLFSVVIGSAGTTTVTGSLPAVNWASGNKFLKVETDPQGGNNFTILANTELASVPYALYAVNGTPGPQGPIGLTGVAGPQGPTGLTGATGPQGAIGLTGPVGPQGPIGLTGAAGPQGPIGLTGPAGPQGPAGPVGATGPQGPIGLTGPAGPQGPVGPIGATGPQGPAGPVGATGPQGPIGLTGPQGPAGTITLPYLATQAGNTASLFSIENTSQGNAASFSNTNAANPEPALNIYGNPAVAAPVVMSKIGIGSTLPLATATAIFGDAAGTTTGITGKSEGGFGVIAESNYVGLSAYSYNSAGASIANGASSGSAALLVNSAANNYAVAISSTHANRRALNTNGAIRHSGINEQAFSVLKGDASGNATWGKSMMAAAYGEIASDGTIIKGSGNFVVSLDLTTREYSILFSNDGSAMNVPIITPRTIGTALPAPSVNIVNSNTFRVVMNTSGANFQFPFFFVVF